MLQQFRGCDHQIMCLDRPSYKLAVTHRHQVGCVRDKQTDAKSHLGCLVWEGVSSGARLLVSSF